MTKHKRRGKKSKDLKSYEISVTDWYVNVYFNEYAHRNIFDLEEFEERILMILEGRINSTTSKKCNKNMASLVILRPRDFWYNRQRIREDLHTIGNMSIEKAEKDILEEDTLYFHLSLPTKSYENIRSYLTYKEKAFVKVIGTELYWRKGEIYYFSFAKESIDLG